ncbi:IclR family transcriptional regulator [Paraburkholderia phenazinium]|jgi:DNA-binding IclR family transcriptional regulator|uniref:DNA-binding transcriptional regulator, IclR family n=1 Tax=Paraburkholderia phenazinium TaxID=60549 RepID=A0A1G8HAY0_9BURK|nr:IclR family transcriptional regulator [Paraburkholderia phenazinium]SDI03739.1 DNA-binding transcriptional regulator, IclR family [Paraburkholderia phenazinium]
MARTPRPTAAELSASTPETAAGATAQANPGEPAAQAPRTRTSAIDRAVQILDALQAANRPATAYEVARMVGAPLSTVYSIINDLVEKNLLARRLDGAIWLGSRLYGYGLTYAGSIDYLAVAAEEMQRLSVEVEETVQVCGLEEGMMVVLQMSEGPGHFRVTSRVGSRVPLNWTASGRLLVGHLPDAERIAFFTQHAQPSPTGRAETRPKVLAQIAKDALEARLSIQIGESDASVACLAAPVLDNAGVCVFTISIVMPEAKAALGTERYAQAVQAVAARIEARLGWRQRES